jgi:hypothetical protein
MVSVEDILNNDYEREIDGHIIEFHSLHKKSGIAIDKLTTYFQNIAKNERTTLYMFHDKFKGNIFAFFQRIDTANGILTNKDFERMIINVLNSKVRLHVKNYDLKVSDPYEHLSFYHWLCYCINKNRGVNFTPYVYRSDQKEDEPDINDIICNMDYIAKFRDNKKSVKYDDIKDAITKKNILIEIQEKTKEHKKQIGKELFIRKLKKHFRFTNDNNDYLSKKVVCDLLDLDYKSKKDIRDLNDILIGYGVSYKDQKMVNKLKGVFLCISLK